MRFAQSHALAAVALTLVCCVGFAAAAKPAVVHLPYGITQVPLTADGIRGVVVRARRDNFNAHGFDVVSVYAHVKSDDATSADFVLVPAWDKDKELRELETSEGADCKLTTFRLLSAPGHDMELVVAHREFGKSYVDVTDVTFTYFTLKRNDAGEPGRPPYYFESARSFKAAHPYCDTDEAFQKELGFGPM